MELEGRWQPRALELKTIVTLREGHTMWNESE